MTAVFKAADPTAIIDGRQSLFVITAPNVDAAARGPRGFAATVEVGTVTTGAPGSSASVVNVGTAEDALLNFSIPRGNTGAAATIAVGTVTTGAPGSSASVVNAGTAGAAIFNFTIPRGADGTGAVNSVQASGGTTGLSFSGGPITNSGTLTLSGTLSISNGGTGATTAAAARTALGIQPLLDAKADLVGADFTGGVKVLSGTDGEVHLQSGGVEIGKTGREDAGTAYVDFHSSAGSPDYDVRFRVTGGDATSGNGALDILAKGGVTLDGPLKSGSSLAFGLTGVLQSLWGSGFENNTHFFVGSNMGRAAVVGFTRSSDNPTVDDMATYAIGGFVEHNSNKYAYGQYTEIRRRSGAGAAHGQEIAVINFGSVVAVTPYNAYAANLTDVLRLSTGRNDTPTQTNISTYVNVVSVGGAKAQKGINFGSDCCVVTGGQQDIINMAVGHAVQWWKANGSRGSRIRYDGGAHSIIFADGIIAFQDDSFSNVATIEVHRFATSGVMKPPSYTVAQLLALPNPQTGDRATVLNVAGGAWLSQITTSGAVSAAPAFFNGSVWCLG